MIEIAVEMQIGEKRTLLTSQLAQTIKQLNADQQKDELAYADELAAREYERSVTSRQNANELAMNTMMTKGDSRSIPMTNESLLNMFLLFSTIQTLLNTTSTFSIIQITMNANIKALMRPTAPD